MKKKAKYYYFWGLTLFILGYITALLSLYYMAIFELHGGEYVLPAFTSVLGVLLSSIGGNIINQLLDTRN